MNFYADETYGERAAGVYDEWYSHVDPSSIDHYLVEGVATECRPDN